MDDDEDEFLEDENEDWGGEEDDGEELQEEFRKVAFRMVREVVRQFFLRKMIKARMVSEVENKEEGDIVRRVCENDAREDVLRFPYPPTSMSVGRTRRG